MRKLYLINIMLITYLTSSFGQIQNLTSHTQMNLDCKKCHVCDTPTKANPCLILCPRNNIEIVRHSPSEGPENIIIDIIDSGEDIYGPANFTHKLHSEMSLMSGGCSICHHFNPPGKIVKCATCHEANRERTDLSKPDLKAAYHRQCMSCHKTWETKSECESCHQLNSRNSKTKQITKIQNVHPEVRMPLKVIYETECDKGNIVTYYHNDHSSLFGIECSDCHDQESCASCHAEFKLESISDFPHDRCSTCHDTEDNCNKCHKDNIAAPFNHKTKTGFALTEFHAGINCISCHKKQKRFTGLTKDCTACHVDKEGIFTHGITGIQLDESHIEFYCEDCHPKNNYKKKPTCSECHDDDISFPNSIPGERIKKQ